MAVSSQGGDYSLNSNGNGTITFPLTFTKNFKLFGTPKFGGDDSPWVLGLRYTYNANTLNSVEVRGIFTNVNTGAQNGYLSWLAIGL